MVLVFEFIMEEITDIAKALSDQNRMRALMALRKGELCVCQLIELFGLAASTVSKHMSILRRCGLVKGRKQGKWMYYSLPLRPSGKIKNILDWINSECCRMEIIKDDQKRLNKIRCE